MTPEEDTHFYRLEKGLVGGRLIPVAREDEATHVGIAALRRVVTERAHDHATITEQGAQIDRMGQRIRELDLLLARAMRRAEQADIMVAGHQAEMARCGAAVRQLLAKNAALIGEKRRLRDALVGKQPLPVVHYRVDLDREDTARESVVITLETFPHKERVHEALAEARHRATREGGQLRSLRLDTPAWRAVIQRVIDDEEATAVDG